MCKNHREDKTILSLFHFVFYVVPVFGHPLGKEFERLLCPELDNEWPGMEVKYQEKEDGSWHQLTTRDFIMIPPEHQFAPEFPGSQRENRVNYKLVFIFLFCFLRKEDTYQIL